MVLFIVWILLIVICLMMGKIHEKQERRFVLVLGIGSGLAALFTVIPVLELCLSCVIGLIFKI